MAFTAGFRLSGCATLHLANAAHVSSILAFAAIPFADANAVLEVLPPEGQQINIHPDVQPVIEDSLRGAISEVATILFSFAFVALVARVLGVGRTVTLQSKKAKAAKTTRTGGAEAVGKSPTVSNATRRQSNPRSSANPPNNGQDRISTMANALAGAVNAGKAAKLPQLLDEAMARLAQGKPADPQTLTSQAAHLLLSSVRACASKRCFREALAAYDHMERFIGEGCGTTWSLLLWSVVEAGRFDRSNFFAKKLRSTGEFSQNDIVNLSRCVVHHKDLKQFVEILDECQAAGSKLEVLTRNRVLAVLTSNQAMDFAGEFVSRTADVPLDVIAYNTLMKGYALSEKPRLCLQLYDQMRSANVTPSDVSYGIVLDACVGGSMFEAAKQIFDDLRASGTAVNVVHYTTFIKGLVSAGSLTEARDVLSEMHKSPRTRPDVITYSTLAKAYADTGNVDDGIYLLKMMKRHGVEPDVILFNIILSACSVNPVEDKKILEVFEQIVSFGFQPTSSTYSVLMKACAKSGCWNLALDFIRSAPSKFGVWPETRIYTQIAQACATAGAGAEVLQTYSLLMQASRANGDTVDIATNMRFVRWCSSCGLGAEAMSSAAIS